MNLTNTKALCVALSISSRDTETWKALLVRRPSLNVFECSFKKTPVVTEQLQYDFLQSLVDRANKVGCYGKWKTQTQPAQADGEGVWLPKFTRANQVAISIRVPLPT